MHITFLNPQGNFDKNDSRWATHPDFGGQLVYVKEVASELAYMGHKVDIVTRQVIDKDWPEFTAPGDSYEGYENLRIVRIKCGPEGFISKENLWPYICPDYTRNLLKLYRDEGSLPEVITAHYGDGGLAAAYIKSQTAIPYTFTAHSLGAQKMDKLKINKYNIEKFNGLYNFSERLIAERISMNDADKIITSTIQERYSQYTHTAYQEAVVIDNDEKFAIVPPGVSLKLFDKSKILNLDKQISNYLDSMIKRDIQPDRRKLPSIISSSRLDPKKNVLGLVQAYAESAALQDSANLVIITSGYSNPLHDYQKLMPGKERGVLIDIISLVDQYNLHGKISMFSIDNQKDLGDMYRYFADSHSVFCLPALYEPFGLAPLEAMACGLPAVVTKFGGPSESLREGDEDFGLLVDPNNPDELAGALFSLVSSKQKWEEFSQKGYKRILDKYTWKLTAESYLEVIKEITGPKNISSIFNIPINNYFTEPDKNDKPSLEALKDLYLNYDILCIGETVVDFISTKKTNSLRDADTFTRYPGGNPANVAVYASKLSKKAILVSKIGQGQFGSFLEREFQKYSVNTEHISYSNEEDTSVSFISQTPTIPDFQNMHSADRKLSMKDVHPDVIECAEIIYTSLSSLVLEPARSAIRKALRIGKQMGKTLVLDPNYNIKDWPDKEECLEMLAQICDGITIVKPSITDARHLFDYNLEEKELVELCIKNFHDWGAQIVLVTAEGRYVVISEKSKKPVRIDDITKIEALDVTGSEEAFLSGFIVAYLEKLPLKKCVYFGNEVAKIAVQSIGPYPKSIFRKDILQNIKA
ncbi:PfkB family carbohydrate kinase [Elusimicrobiota bacterium]